MSEIEFETGVPTTGAEQALEILERIPADATDDQIIIKLLNAAQCLREAKEFRKSLEAHLIAVDISSCPDEKALIWFHAAHDCRSLGDFEAALHYAGLAMDSYSRENKKGGVAIFAGHLCVARQEPEAAEEWFDYAEKLLSTDNLQKAQVWAGAGNNYKEHKYFELAAKCLLKAVGLRPADSGLNVKDLKIAGDMCSNIKEFEQAIQHYKNAWQLAIDLQEKARISDCIGHRYQSLRDYGSAADWFTQAAGLEAKPALKCRMLCQAANNYQLMDNWEKAINCLKQVPEIETDPDRRAICLNRLAICYSCNNQQDLANQTFDEVMAIDGVSKKQCQIARDSKTKYKTPQISRIYMTQKKEGLTSGRHVQGDSGYSPAS